MIAPDGENAAPRLLIDAVRQHIAARDGKPALVFEGVATSYAALERQARQVASGLRAAGIAPGERISYLGRNCAIYFDMLLGATLAGAVMTPLNWRLAVPEIAWIMQDAGVRLLFLDSFFADREAALRDAVPGLAVVLSTDAYPAWRDAQRDDAPEHPASPGDVAVQIYTSGTTGRPKGAMLTHRSVLALRALPPAQQPVWNRWTDDDVSLVVNPVFHISGTGFGMQTLCAGATGIVLREFDAGRVLELIDRERLSKVFVVPSSMQMMLRHPRARAIDYSRVRYMIYGASPIPLDLLREAMDVFKCGFVQMYGMTETSGTVVSLLPEDHDPAGTPRMRAAGRAMPGVELAILDAEGKHLPPHRVGEIAVRSPTNMAGYWHMPQATAATLSADNWLRTGDAGYMDEDGYVYVHDRVKDMIISGGENIYPAEVENAIFGHPDVAEVAVIGVPSEKWGEEVKALVVPRPGTQPDPAAIIAWTRARIAHYKAPKSVAIIAALPRNPSGKVLRRELRAPFWQGREKQI